MQQPAEKNCNLAAATSCYNCKRPRSLARPRWTRSSLLGRGICIHIRRPILDSDSFAVNRWNWESKSNRHLLNWISLVLPVKVWPINYYCYKLNLIKTSLRFQLKNQWNFTIKLYYSNWNTSTATHLTKELNKFCGILWGSSSKTLFKSLSL